MVRKTKASTSACPTSQTDSRENPNDSSEKKTLIFLSFPVIMIFNALKYILFELFIVLKFIYNSSSRILNKPAVANNGEVLEVVKGDDNKGTEMDLLQLQKHHHKKAFEYISQALKIDETQNAGLCRN